MTIPVEDGRVPLSTSAPEEGKDDRGSGFEPLYELSEGWTGTRLDRPKLDEIKRLARVREIDAVLIFRWFVERRLTLHQVAKRLEAKGERNGATPPSI